MSRIRDIRVVPLSFASPEPYGSARGLARACNGSLVLLETEDGVQGIGEGAGPGAVLQTRVNVLRPFYVGRRVFAQRAATRDVLARMYHAGTQNQMTALLGGIDLAAHDTVGRLLRLSIADLIGRRLRTHPGSRLWRLFHHRHRPACGTVT